MTAVGVGARNRRKATAKIQKRKIKYIFFIKKNTFNTIVNLKSESAKNYNPKSVENPYFFKRIFVKIRI